MASYHCTVKVGGKGKAASHSAYISRLGKYSGRERYEDLESTAHGNMPPWAEHNPAHFWCAADEHERANGATYREIQVALPRELTPDQRRALVEDFIAQEIGDKHAYQWAIHTPKAALEGGEQPHAHVMYSERARDGLDRDPEQYFKRYNAKSPEKGGCRKDSAGTKERLQATRERWADVQNAHLERHGVAVRVDHRSLKEQGIDDRQPEKHIGASRVKDMQAQDVAALLARRAAEGELERAQRQVSSAIDLSRDLAAARAQFEAHKLAEADKALKIAPSAFAGLSVAELADAIDQTRRRLESTDELARRDPDVSRLDQHRHGLAEQHWQALAEAERHRREAEAFRDAHGVQAWLHARGLGHSVKLLAMEQAQEAAQAKAEQAKAALQQAEQAHDEAYTAAVWRARAEQRPDDKRLTALSEALRAEIARQEQAEADRQAQARPAPSRRPTHRPAAERDDDLSM